jgi:hypothetical protein
MKKLLAPAVIVSAISILFGCGTIPNVFDRTVFDVTTNYVPRLVLQTNTYLVPVFQTNAVMVVTYQTNIVHDNQIQITPVTVTNTVVSTVMQTNTVTTTNQITVPQYVLTPGATVEGIKTIGGIAGAPYGVGGLVTGGLGALAAIYTGWRNRQFKGQNDALSQTAGTLAQVIETGREVLKTTPQGQQADAAFKQWMISHQAVTGVISDVSDIVKEKVDNDEAKRAADQIKLLMNPAPTPAKA